MKTIYFFRHAKSSWDFPELSDVDRPLMDTGIARTKKVIRFLNKKEVEAELIISSHTVRAFETAKLIARGTGYPEEKIRVEKVVYEGDYEHILEMIYGLPDTVNSVMIFGHNPNLTLLTNRFARPRIDNLATSCVACFSFPAEKWEEISSCDPVTEFIIFPDMLK